MSDKRLFRSRQNRMLLGVCGGLGEYFNIDPTLVRVLTIVLMVMSLSGAAIVYLLAAVVIPEEGAPL